TGDLANRLIRRQRDALPAAVTVLDERVVSAQVESHDNHPGAVRQRERERLPPACGQPQCGVLKLRLWRRQRGGQLAENLRVRMQRVAGRAPPRVLERRPPI